MTATFLAPKIETFVSQLTIDLQKLKKLEIDSPDVIEIIKMEEKLLLYLQGCIERNKLVYHLGENSRDGSLET